MRNKNVDLAIVLLFVGLVVVPILYKSAYDASTPRVGDFDRRRSPPDAEQIDPFGVQPLADLARRDNIVISLFEYDDTDERAWPTDLEHRKYVRFIQDNGITVAFGKDEDTGKHFVAVGDQDIDFVKALDGEAEKLGLTKPHVESMPGRLIAEGEVDGVTFSLRAGDPDRSEADE